jgi:glycosyltransferase involved in cell wall biosynthesis
MASVSILILTKNEEESIDRCIQSVLWSNDIVVFDSYSADSTVERAEKLGARVEYRSFDNYAAQRNAALALDFKNDWILMVDADEVVSSELREEIENVLRDVSPSIDLFQMRRKDYFFGRWIKHASAYPTWFGRLVRKGRVSVQREINEEYHAQGETQSLEGHLIHYPFCKGIAFWFERHNRYSSMEALVLIDEVLDRLQLSDLWSPQATARRKALKQIAYRLPCRPFTVFLFLYFFRMGFLDGLPGLRFALMRSMYEYMIDLKVAEQKYKKSISQEDVL